MAGGTGLIRVRLINRCDAEFTLERRAGLPAGLLEAF